MTLANQSPTIIMLSVPTLCAPSLRTVTKKPPERPDTDGNGQCDIARSPVKRVQEISSNRLHTILPVERWRRRTDVGIRGGPYANRLTEKDWRCPRDKSDKPDGEFTRAKRRATGGSSQGSTLIGDETANLSTGSKGYSSSMLSDESAETIKPLDHFPPRIDTKPCGDSPVDEPETGRAGDAGGSQVDALSGPVADVPAAISEPQGRGVRRRPVRTISPSEKRKGHGISNPGIQVRSPQTARRAKRVLDKAGRVPLLSCPFYKWKPWVYKKCRSTGLRNISCLKEHLVSCHLTPLHCPRCYAEFKTIQERDEHLRPIECERKELRVMEGYGEAARRDVESRVNMRKPAPAQWAAIYEILFPGQGQPDSPFTVGKLTGSS